MLLQLSNMVDEEATQTAEWSQLFLTLYFVVYKERELCLLLTLWVAIFESQLGGGQDSLTF